MELARTLLRIEQVAHALRVTTEAVGTPGVREKLDAWVGEGSRRLGGARLHKAAKVVATASDAAPLACGAAALGESTRASEAGPAVFAAVAVGIPVVAPLLVERMGGPALPPSVRRSIVDGASYAALGRLGGTATAPVAVGALAAGVARVHLGADPTEVAAGTAAGWVWARLTAVTFARLRRRRGVPPPVEIDDYRERRSTATQHSP